MKKLFIIFITMFLLRQGSLAQQKPYSQQMAQTVMAIWPDYFSINRKPARRLYDQGDILKGIEGIWKLYGDAKYFTYIQQSVDHFVQEDGSIKEYKKDECTIDYRNNDKAVMMLYNVTGKEKYKKAIDRMRSQADEDLRTREGGLRQKETYPWQVWLDSLYMGQAFYAEYSKLSGQANAFDDIAKQFINTEKHARDAKTGLLYHGKQLWPNKQTGTSPHFWANAMAGYGVVLVDVLDHFPTGHPKRDSMIAILNRFVKAIVTVQDAGTGLWYDSMNLPGRQQNYEEASASCMLVYTIAKAVRNRYISAAYLKNAQKAYAGIIKEFIEVDAGGKTNLKGTVTVSGLGRKSYRDGSFDYYRSEPVMVNDPTGMGAFIMCSVEMEMAALPKPGKGKKVLLDGYFNNEWKKTLYGINGRRHYTWDDAEDGGFSVLGDIFKSYGAALSTLEKEPSAANLKGSAVYIIVDPDGLKDNNNPNYVNEKDAENIAAWVKAGGVLLLMANDTANCDVKHLNTLAHIFGIHFSDKSINMVKENDFEIGAVFNNEANPVFKKTKKMYLKDICVIEVKPPASALLKKGGDVIFATAKYGKGSVFAVGDPWLYNEYTDGRKLPAEFENFGAANELAQWLLLEAKP